MKVLHQEWAILKKKSQSSSIQCWVWTLQSTWREHTLYHWVTLPTLTNHCKNTSSVHRNTRISVRNIYDCVCECMYVCMGEQDALYSRLALLMNAEITACASLMWRWQQSGLWDTRHLPAEVHTQPKKDHCKKLGWALSQRKRPQLKGPSHPSHPPHWHNVPLQFPPAHWHHAPVPGFTLGNTAGMHLAQNYDLLNLTKKKKKLRH